MFDQSLKGVDTKLLSLLALLSNKTNEMQLTASFENEYRRHSLFKPLNITFPFDGTDLQHLNKTHIHLVNIKVYLFILLQNIKFNFLLICLCRQVRRCVNGSYANGWGLTTKSYVICSRRCGTISNGL